MTFLLAAAVAFGVFIVLGTIEKLVWPEKPIDVLDLSQTLYPFTTVEEVSALEAKRPEAYRFIASNARAKASFMATYRAVRRCNKAVELEVYPMLRAVK